MKLLCLSNGHGEDEVAVRILQAWQQLPGAPELVALPIVGEGHPYIRRQIPLLTPGQNLPSGGFIYMDGWQLLRDVRGGLLQLTWEQLLTVRAWARQGGMILAVGDLVPLLFAWWSGATYAFVGTAKSEYHRRDEAGPLPRRIWWQQWEGWSASIYLPWECWLMGRPRCRAIFPRDRLTAEMLQQLHLPVFDLGNPMMDDLVSTVAAHRPGDRPAPVTILLLPGSRAPEAYANWELILTAVAGLVSEAESWQFLAAIAPGLERERLIQSLQYHGWQPSPVSISPPMADPTAQTLIQGASHLTLLSHQVFGTCLDRADLAIAMAGTATEQFVGLGKPVITLPGQGPQFTYRFAEAQSRLLGISVTLVATPAQVSVAVRELLAQPQRLAEIAANGRRRMGQPGAAQRIAACLHEQLLGTKPVEA